MKILLQLLFITFSIFTIPSYAQQCDKEISEFNTSTINTVVSPLDMWWDGRDGIFEYPVGGGVSPIHNGGFWLSGFVLDTPRASTQLFQRPNFFGPGFEFREGPSRALDSLYFCEAFKITRSAVDQHIADFADGQLDNPISEIINWPGRGNVNGPAILSQDEFAPFEDLNGNQVYEPEQGEYPKFAGDQAAWWVANTINAPNQFSATWDAELHVLVQAYNENASDQVLKTLFYTATLINRGSAPIDTAALTLRVDPDVGCFTDDAIGSIPDLKLVFSYNFDVQDGTTGSDCEQGVATYPGAIPVPVTQILSARTSLPNIGATHNASYTLSSEDVPRPPVGLIDETISFPPIYYSLAHGRFLDNSRLTRGGTGFAGTTELVDWPFDGNPADTSAWSACRLIGRDYKYHLNTILDNPLPTDERLTVDYAVYVVDDVALPCPSTDLIRDAANEVLTFFEQEVSSTKEAAFPKIIKSFNTFPNPSSGSFQCVLPKGVEIKTLSAIDVTGKTVSLQWEIQAGSASAQLSTSGIYFLIAEDREGNVYRSRVVVE